MRRFSAAVGCSFAAAASASCVSGSSTASSPVTIESGGRVAAPLAATTSNGLPARFTTMMPSLPHMNIQRRLASTVVTASNFEAEVMQSQQAVVLVFHIPTSGCNSFIQSVEAVADTLNKSSDAKWLKLCICNADENSNLASVFSVERNRLPVTYFLYQATIVDKVYGQVQRARVEAILAKFHEYYLRQQGVDLSASVTSKGGQLAAETELLTDAAPTSYLQQRVMGSLIGAERIQLPQDAEKLESLKKLIQQAKKQSVREVKELYNNLGMDVKRMEAEEMQKQYYGSQTFTSAGILSGLEALFMARICGAASQGTVKISDVEEALKAIESDFAPILGDVTLRKVMALTQALLQKHRAVSKIEKMVTLSEEEQTALGGEAEADNWRAVIRWVEAVDARVLPDTFPKDLADEMFTMVRKNVALAKKNEENKAKLEAAKQVLLALIQLFHSSADAQAARSRLSSMMF